MTKKMFMVLAATLICGASVFTSCTSDTSDNPVVDNLAEKLIGKWMMATDMDGQPALTDNKEVITFVSPTKAYASRSRGEINGDSPAPEPQNAPEGSPESQPGAAGWDNYIECDVEISGNTVILKSQGPNGTTNSVKYIIKSISSSKFDCEVVRDAPGGSMVAPPDGDKNEEVKMNNNQKQRFVKVTKDYKQDIIGLWECQEITGGETNNDSNARLEFKADGTYSFYRHNDAGEWETVTTREVQEYYVDGTYLCTRWKEAGATEQREWWEIVELSGSEMQWTALRQNADGTTFVQGTKWKKVE